MRKVVGESNPAMLRLLPDRNRRRWEVGVIKSTDGNTDLVWPQVGLPKYRRSACRAEMHPDLSPLLSVADIDLGWSIGANMLPLEKGNNAEHRAGPPLTLATMAGAYGIGIAGHLDTQGTTGTMRGSRHNYPSVINRVEVPDHLSHSEDGRGSSCCPRSPTTLRSFRLRCGTLPRKSNCALRPDGGNGPIGPCCVPSYVVHAATRFRSVTARCSFASRRRNHRLVRALQHSVDNGQQPGQRPIRAFRARAI